MPTPITTGVWGTPLLIHARPKEAPAVAALCAHEPVGAVFVTASPAGAQASVATMREANESTPVLIDVNLYSGKGRKHATAGISARWIATQHELGVTWALSDSGYVADGDINGLSTILGAARKFDGRVIAVLPLAGSWWDEGHRQALTDQIEEYGVPVALILEHADDPFSALRTVKGVVNLLAEASVPVMILRSDLSGLGVLAYGGVAAAIGTSSSLRHLYPASKNGGGRPPQISLLWPRGLAYRTVEKLTDAIAADPDSTNWLCDCSVCYGRSIEWILNSSDQHTNAFRHSVAAIQKLAESLVSATLTAEQRQASWLEKCRVAQSYSFEVADISGRGWEPPKALNAWNRAFPVRVS